MGVGNTVAKKKIFLPSYFEYMLDTADASGFCASFLPTRQQHRCNIQSYYRESAPPHGLTTAPRCKCINVPHSHILLGQFWDTILWNAVYALNLWMPFGAVSPKAETHGSGNEAWNEWTFLLSHPGYPLADCVLPVPTAIYYVGTEVQVPRANHFY